MSATFNIKGLKELQAELDKLPAKIEANVMRSALRAGAKVIEAEVKQNIPVSPPNDENARLYGSYTGALRDSVRVSTRSRRGVVSASVKAGNAAAWYWRFVEFGTAAHWIKPKSRSSLFLAGVAREVVLHPGARAKPFMRPALDAKMVSAVEAVREQVRRKLASAKLSGQYGTQAPSGGDA